MGELVTFRGSVSGTGVYTLDSDILYSPVTEVRIPRGLKVKIWSIRISGEAADVAVQYTPDITAATVVWKTVDSEKLASAGEIVVEKRRPIVLRGFTGREAFRVVRLTGLGDSFVTLEVEFEQ